MQMHTKSWYLVHRVVLPNHRLVFCNPSIENKKTFLTFQEQTKNKIIKEYRASVVSRIYTLSSDQ